MTKKIGKIPGKILEKLIHTQLSHYIEDSGLLSDNQFGFRKQRSTSHAISQVLNQIYTTMNRSAVTVAVYIDFSKAFNCVQHPTLLRKLYDLNLGSDTIQWITSYLGNREQRTLANGVYSSSLPVTQGVSQGSVLGLLFYIIYSNDITENIRKSGFAFYADDTVIYSKKKSLDQATAYLQDDLDGLSQWCTQNGLTINVNKTKVMFYGNRAKINASNMPDFYINGQPIDRTKAYTYLGIKLDEQLSLDMHANLLIKRVSNKIYQLTKEKLYPTDDLHVAAKLLKLKDRRHMHVLLHMFQLAQMPNFKLWKTHQAHGVRTRSSKKKLITSRKPTNEKYKKSITYQGSKLWNSLPSHVQQLDSYYEFKGNIKKLFQPKPLKKTKPKPKPKQTRTVTTADINKNNRNKNKNKNGKTKQNKTKQNKTKPRVRDLMGWGGLNSNSNSNYNNRTTFDFRKKKEKKELLIV